MKTKAQTLFYKRRNVAFSGEKKIKQFFFFKEKKTYQESKI